MTTATKADRIAELEATPRALVGSDSGTHDNPRSYDIYEEITGERYAVSSFGGSNGDRCTEEEAREGTHGRIRVFSSATSDIRAAARELKALRFSR